MSYLVFILYSSLDPPDLHSFPTRCSSDLRRKRASKITCRRSDVMSKGKKRSGARPGRFLPLDITSLLLDRKSGSAGMPRPISYAVFCLKKKKKITIYTTYNLELLVRT